MNMDFNNAPKQQSSEPIPAKTIVPCLMVVRPGGAGDDGWLKQSKNSDAMMLDCEFTVLDGPHAKRKFWQFMVVSGGKVNDKGESIAGNISRTTLRAILESCRQIKSDDMSDVALQARRINGWGDFNGMTFVCRVGIEKGTAGYSDKNKILEVLTPGHNEYAYLGGQQAVAQPETAYSAPAAAAPSWAAQTPPPAAAAVSAGPVPSWAR